MLNDLKRDNNNCSVNKFTFEFKFVSMYGTWENPCNLELYSNIFFLFHFIINWNVRKHAQSTIPMNASRSIEK